MLFSITEMMQCRVILKTIPKIGSEHVDNQVRRHLPQQNSNNYRYIVKFNTLQNINR